MEAKPILRIVPGLQATSLLAYNVKNMPKFKMKPSKQMGMKKPVKKLMKTGITNIVGIGMIRPTVEMINKL